MKWRDERRLYKIAKAKLKYTLLSFVKKVVHFFGSPDVRNQITTFTFQFSLFSSIFIYFENEFSCNNYCFIFGLYFHERKRLGWRNGQILGGNYRMMWKVNY